MSSIDLILLGILMEKPQSAYDIQKDVAYHHFPRWTKISVPSIYKKVLQPWFSPFCSFPESVQPPTPFKRASRS